MRTGADAGSAELGGKIYEEEYFGCDAVSGSRSVLCRADKGTVWRSGGGLFLQYK